MQLGRLFTELTNLTEVSSESRNTLTPVGSGHNCWDTSTAMFTFYFICVTYVFIHVYK